jgi:uncharacterized protein (TIGR03643 family)
MPQKDFSNLKNKSQPFLRFWILANRKSARTLSAAELSDVIEMALSDHTRFDQIKALYGLSEPDVKALMRNSLRRGSYVAWRKRVQQFSQRRAHYK